MKFDREKSESFIGAFGEECNMVIFHAGDHKIFYLFEGPIEVYDEGIKYESIDGHEGFVRNYNHLMSVCGISHDDYDKFLEEIERISGDPYYAKIDYVTIKTKKLTNNDFIF